MFHITIKDQNAWDSIVSQFSCSHVFHTWGWAKSYSDAYSHEPILCCYGTPSAVDVALPLSKVKKPFGKVEFVSMPYSDFAGPLFRTSIPDAYWAQLFSYLGVKNLQLRTDREIKKVASFCSFSTYRIKLPSDASLFMRKLPAKSVRYPIRKATSDGYRVRLGKTEDIPLFHHLMSLTRRKHGLPTPPHCFYQALFTNVIAAGNGTILIAENSQGTPVASSVFLWHRGKGYYKYNASDPSARVGNANHLLLWEGVSEAIRRKCISFDLGRASKDNIGLINFKKHWLGEEYPLSYLSVRADGEVRAVSSEESKIHHLSRKVLQLLPVCFSKFSGEMMYRYFS